jgi:glycosyltransferase involved in cell wall biosynthesis
MVLVGFDLRGSMIEGIENGKMKRRAMTPEETVWHQYEKIFTSNWMLVSQFPDYLRYLQKYTPDPYDPNNDEVERNMPYRRLWTRDINNYARNYNNLDISLAPLEETKFNLYKSQLKVVEAGFFKKALVAQNYGAYTIDLINVFDGQNINPKGNAVLIDSLKNHKQWYQSLKRLVDNPELITMLGENLYETVKDKYDLRKVTTQRAEFYRSIL